MRPGDGLDDADVRVGERAYGVRRLGDDARERAARAIGWLRK
jgi:hypothetical protein